MVEKKQERDFNFQKDNYSLNKKTPLFKGSFFYVYFSFFSSSGKKSCFMSGKSCV